MAILNTISLESNKQIKINWGGGDLSSDGGLLLIKEFAARIGLLKLIKQLFKTNDHTTCRKHTDAENLMQMIYQIIAAYFEDDCADELINDPVLTAILEKDTLASQPTLSRFWNRMDADTLAQHDKINAKMREIVYSIKKPEQMLFDLDSTLLNTYGKQEGEAFNFHYQAHGYHPLLCYDGLTGDLLKAELRDGTQYCSNGADQFMIPLMQEYRTKYPSMPLYMRGDSGFAAPSLYEACEANDCKYAIHLKQNATLVKYASDEDQALYRAKITGINRYKGTINEAFKIKKATQTVKAVTPKSGATKTVAIGNSFTIKATASKEQGTAEFKKDSGDSRLTISSSGKVTAKKGLVKGRTYTLKYKVRIKATKNCKATKYVTRTVKVKIKM